MARPLRLMSPGKRIEGAIDAGRRGVRRVDWDCLWERMQIYAAENRLDTVQWTIYELLKRGLDSYEASR